MIREFVDEWLAVQRRIACPSATWAGRLARVARVAESADAEALERTLREVSIVTPGEAAKLEAYFAEYDRQVRPHRPVPPQSHRPLGGLRARALARAIRWGLDLDPFNALARVFGWPEVDAVPEGGADALAFYNLPGRDAALRAEVEKALDQVEPLLREVHRNLCVDGGPSRVPEVDVFVIAGGSGPLRGRYAAGLMRRAPASYAVTLGFRGRYLGNAPVAMSEALATALTILEEARAEIAAPRILLGERSRVTADHVVEVRPILAAIHAVRGRPLRIGAVTRGFHSLRYVLSLEAGLEENPAVAEIIPLPSRVDLDEGYRSDKRRVGYVLNEFMKVLHDLATARD